MSIVESFELIASLGAVVKFLEIFSKNRIHPLQKGGVLVRVKNIREPGKISRIV
jgi:hypothetical protein